MKRFMNKRMLAIGLAVAIALGGGGAAFAYFTATGNTTGTAQVGVASNWQFTVTDAPTLLYPDPTKGTGNIQTENFQVKNVGSGDQNLASVTIEVANSDGSAFSYQPNPAEPACTAADFSVGGAAVGTPFLDTSSPPTGTYTNDQITESTVTVQMIDNHLNQDNCQNLSVPLYFSTNPALSIDFGRSGNTTTVGGTINLTVNAYQPGVENADGTEAFTFNNTDLTFVSAGDGTCTAISSGGDTTETCTLTDMSHSIKSDSFTFTALAAGPTTINVVVSITGSGSATQAFPVTIS